jgi:hypothetical protein
MYNRGRAFAHDATIARNNGKMIGDSRRKLGLFREATA